MDDITREKLLRAALVTVGAIFFTIYPLSLVWPSGWQWHNGGGQYYFQMICGVYAVLGAYLIAAARDPSEHRSLISFTVSSSVVHAGIMAVQATYDRHEMAHFGWRRACASVGCGRALELLSRQTQLGAATT